MLVRNRNTQFCKVFTNSYLQCRRCYEYKQHTYNKVIKQWHHHLHLLPLIASISKYLLLTMILTIEDTLHYLSSSGVIDVYISRVEYYLLFVFLLLCSSLYLCIFVTYKMSKLLFIVFWFDRSMKQFLSKLYYPYPSNQQQNNIVGTFPKSSSKLVENENRYPMCTIHDPSLYWLSKCNSMKSGAAKLVLWHWYTL